MSNFLYLFPKQALVGQPLPKRKIYDHAKPSTALREKFVKQVDKIIWQYKLAPETIHLEGSAQVPEIQVFSLTLRSPEIGEEVLRCIDQAIPYPILYYLNYENQVKSTIAYKRPYGSGSDKWVVDAYFESSWQFADVERVPLPVSLNLAGLYEQMVRHYLPLPARAGESLKAQVERLEQIRCKQNEYQKLEARLQKEKQFNRKVELNAQLRSVKKELEMLSR